MTPTLSCLQPRPGSCDEPATAVRATTKPSGVEAAAGQLFDGLQVSGMGSLKLLIVMCKVLVFLAVLSLAMACITAFGMGLPDLIRRWHMKGGWRRRVR
eukprot:COSAG01_NODE_2363_length_7826_cov_11.548337_2_plen_99_part_00